MNRAQKLVVSVATGAALIVVASAVVSAANGPIDGGWFMYVPNSNGFVDASWNGGVLRAAGVWLAAVAVWLVVSWRLFSSDE